MVIAISEETVRELEITLETACRVRIDRYVDVILLLFDYLLIGYINDTFSLSFDKFRPHVLLANRHRPTRRYTYFNNKYRVCAYPLTYTIFSNFYEILSNRMSDKLFFSRYRKNKKQNLTVPLYVYYSLNEL